MSNCKVRWWPIAAVFVIAGPSVCAADVQTLLYLADGGPLVIEFDVRIDGKSCAQVRSEFVQRLFQQIDRDDSGDISGGELGLIPDSRQFESMQLIRGDSNSRSAARVDASPRDGKVTLEELTAYLERFGVGEPTVRIQRRSIQASGNPYQTQLGAETRLFEQLDRNSDGKLAAAEFALSSDLLKMDLDDDETLSRNEMLPLINPYLSFHGPSNPRSGAQFLHLGAGQSSTQTIRQILVRYDTDPKDHRLSKTEIGLPQGTFSKLDADGNGQLDFDELRQFVRSPAPQVEIRVWSGNVIPSSAPIEVVRAAGDLKDNLRNGPDGAVTISLGKVQLQIDCEGDGGVRNSTAYQRQFAAFDRDSNGYLDLEEAKDSRALLGSFGMMDGDDDGKVFQKEFVAHYQRVDEAARNRVTLNVVEQGNQLFDILDANRDGRLGSRELVRGRERIKAWDDNADDHVQKSEIPRSWRLSVVRGRSGIGNEPVATAVAPGAAPMLSRRSGPRWFQSMDRNGDGEVTQREFLGKSSDFAKIDADSDDAISAAEAATVD